MVIQNGKSIVKKFLSQICEDNKLVYVQPKFENNPLGYVLWGLLKNKNMNDIDRKFSILHGYAKKEDFSYGKGRIVAIEEQIRDLDMVMVEKYFRKFADLCKK
jgi:hypothetical protein